MVIVLTSADTLMVFKMFIISVYDAEFKFNNLKAYEFIISIICYFPLLKIRQ